MPLSYLETFYQTELSLHVQPLFVTNRTTPWCIYRSDQIDIRSYLFFSTHIKMFSKKKAEGGSEKEVFFLSTVSYALLQ